MFSLLLTLLPILVSARAIATSPNTTQFPVHNIARIDDLRFENLAIRSNGQILTTTTMPNASIYQVDPLGILPPTLIHTIPNVTSATGIVEGSKPDHFYIASSDVSLTDPFTTHPSSYFITELNMQGVIVLPNGHLSHQPKTKRIANLPAASLLNGIAFSHPHSNHLLVADSFRGLIWNVNVHNGTVGVTLNDTTTKGSTPTGSTFTGVNGIKVHDGTLFWTSTGRSSMYKIGIDEQGCVRTGHKPVLIASNITCDDLVIDHEGKYAYVAGPLDVITRVDIEGGGKEIIAGTYNSTSSALLGPSAIRFGRLVSDRWSMYITTNGGLGQNVPGSMGISRIDLGEK